MADLAYEKHPLWLTVNRNKRGLSLDLKSERGRALFLRLVAEGFVRPVIGARFPFERASEALKLIDERGATGKVVLEVG